MATQTATRTSRTPIAVLLVALIALMGGVFGINVAWGDDILASLTGVDEATNQTCDDESPVKGEIVSTDGTINGTPYSVVTTEHLFPSQLMLDPSLKRDFTVSVSGTDNARVEDVSDKPMHNDQEAPLGTNQDVYSYKYYKFGGTTQDGWIAVDKGKTPEQMAESGRDVVDAIAVAFGDKEATKGKQEPVGGMAAVEESFKAARDATITVNYGTVGTYSYNDSRGTVPVNMQLVVTNIVPHTSVETESGRIKQGIGNFNPIFQFAKDPNYGIYFYNVHSADFDIVLTNADTGDALGVDDIYLTQSSLSYWQNGKVQITEMSKPLSKVAKVYFSDPTNMSTTTGDSFVAVFDDKGQVSYSNDGSDGFFVPVAGEDNKPGNNHYTDTVGHEEFPRNAVTFRYADTSHMNFRNATSSNTMWFTIYPQALTNQTPPDPIKTAYTEPTKGVYGEGENIPEGSVRRGSEIEFVVDQEVNKLGISSLVRYHELVLSDVVPNDVTIKDYDVVDEDGNSVASHGEWTKRGEDNTYTFSFDREWLQGDMPLNGEHYYLKLKGIVNEDAADVFKNKAETVVNELAINGCIYNHFFSNVTEMNVVEPNTSLLLTNLDEEFTFQVAYRVPEDANEINITDELEPILEAIDASASGLEGVDAVISADKKTITVSAKDSEDEKSTVVTDARGKVVTLTIKAKIRDGVTAQQLDPYIQAGGIPNTAKVVVNNDSEFDTNKVVVVPPPVKKINDQFELVELEKRPEQFTYTVSQLIPSDATTVTFEDELKDVLEVVSTSIDGKASYANETSGNTVKYSTTDATNDREQVVTLTIVAKIKDTVTDAELIEKFGSTTVPNKATVTIDDKAGVTNEVYVKPPSDPEKTINDQKGKVELENRDEQFTYKVVQTVPAGATKATFTDELESVLEVVSYEIDNAAFTASYDEATNTVSAAASGTEDAPIVDKDTVVTLTIVAKINSDVTDADLIEKYGSTTVPNKAKVSINDKEKTTNIVEVTPPSDPEKTINDQKGKVELENRDEQFTYKVVQTVPAGATKATFTDELESVLEVVSYEIDNAAFTASYDEATNTVSAAASGTEEAPIVDKDTVVTLTIVAKINSDVTDADLIEKYGSTTVPNKAKVSINDKEKTTNIVEVTPPDEPGSDPEKKVNDVEAYTLKERPEVFTYTISQKYPGDAKTASFQDTLEDVLEITETPTIDGKGTYDIQVDGNKVTVIGLNVIADRGQVVTLTIKAKLRDDVTDEQLIKRYGSTNIPNEAKVAINNNPKTTNEVTVTPPDSPTEDPEKKVNGQKELVELTERAETFTYTVSQKVPEGAKTVTFEDTLEDVLEIVGTPATDGTATYAVTVEGNKVVAATEDAKADWNAVVTLTIQAKIRDNVTDADLLAKYNSLVVPNKATVTINDIPKTTNEVDVTPPPEETEITKTVNDKLHADLEAAEEEFTYQIKVDVPYDADTVVVTDTLVDELEFVSTADEVVVDFGEEDIDAETTIDGQTLTVSFDTIKKAAKQAEASQDVPAADEANEVSDEAAAEEAADEAASENAEGEVADEATDEATDEAAADEGTTDVPAVDEASEEPLAEEAEEEVVGDIRAKSVTITFKAKIRSGADISKYLDDNGNPRVPNTASYTINNDPNRTFDSNTVTVTPPTPPADDPEKFINGQKELVTLENRTDTFTYTVTQKVPANAVSVVFEDTVESVLEVVSATIDGSATYTDETSGNAVKFSTSDPAADREKTVTLTIVAKLRNEVTDAQLVELYGSTQVPNQATVTINNNPKTTNIVKVTPPDDIEIIPPDDPHFDPPTPEEPETPNNPPADNPPTVTPPTTNNPPVSPTPVTGSVKTADTFGPVVAGLVALALLALAVAVLSLRCRASVASQGRHTK